MFRFNTSTAYVKNSRVILVILHQANSSSGRVGQYLQARGFKLDIRRPALGDPLPKTLENYAGAIIFGGPMSANTSEDFIKKEIDWIEVPLNEDKPFLGICLGGQMLAKKLGADVKALANGSVEIGWYPVNPTENGRALFQWPNKVYHFHHEGIFGLPQDAELLATGETYPNQAFRYGENAWGLQFHAELTRAMMQRWIVHGADKLTQKGAQPGSAHLEGRFIYDGELKTWLFHALDKIFQ